MSLFPSLMCRTERRDMMKEEEIHFYVRFFYIYQQTISFLDVLLKFKIIYNHIEFIKEIYLFFCKFISNTFL